MRVTQETFYRQTMFNLLRMRYGEYVMNNQAASAKRINSPSDDPVGSIASQGSHRMMEEIEQYGTTVQHVRDWLRQGDSSMQSMSDYLAQVKTKAEQASTGTYTAQQLALIGKDTQVMMSHLVELANAQVDGKYIFAGAQNDTPAINTAPEVQSPALGSDANVGTGDLYGQGDYTGRKSRLVNITVDSVTAGGPPMNISYSYIDDFGRTISGKTAINGVGTAFAVDVGEGAQVYLDQGTYTAGNTYTLTIGRNNGDQESLDANLSRNYRLRYNFALNDLYGQEGNVNGQWGNVLDMMADWQDSLAKDDTTQTSFETIAGRYNNPGSSADLNVAGDYTQLKTAQLQVQVGGPIQFRVSDPTLSDATVAGRQYRFYLDDPTFTGEPSATNPMDLHVAWLDTVSGNWQDGGVVTATGTGPENAVTLNDDPNVKITLAQASYDSTTIAGWGAGLGVAPPFTPVVAAGYQSMSTYPDKTTPSPANPVNFTYSYNDGKAERRFGTIAFTGTGDDHAWNVPLSEATLNVASNVDATTLQGRQYEFYLDPASLTGTPSAANPLTLHYRYKDAAGAWVDGGNVNVTGTGPEHMVQLAAANPGEDVRFFLADGSYDTTNIGTWPAGSTAAAALTMDFAGPRATVSLSKNGTVDDGDFYGATLEQYHQGQALSQTTLAKITGIQANLLKQLGDAGARLDNMDVRDNLLEADNVRLQDRLSKVEDADITEVTTNLTLYQTLYEATLQATAMVTSKSLADYL
jgi:flagellar hook-associated protein 3 FlgL